jgi:hypothetical protein
VRKRRRFRFLSSASDEFRKISRLSKGPLRDFKTGTGFAPAKLSEILPAGRVALFVRMTENNHGAGVADDAGDLTPNPFP